MRNDLRQPSHEVIAVRVPEALAKDIRMAARQDDRTLSGYLRRLLAEAVQPRAAGQPKPESR